MLVFYSDMHPISKNFVARLKEAAARCNEKANALCVRVATVSCDQEMAIAQQFQADRIGIPLTYMLYKGQMLDRLSGELDAATLDKTCEAFMKAVTERFGFKAAGEPQKGADMPADENSAAYHVQEAKKLLESPEVDFNRVDAMLDKARKICAAPIETFKASIGFGQKRITPEMIEKMKHNPHMQCMASTVGTQLAVALRRNDTKAALALAHTIRTDFGWALRDDRNLAHDVVLVEMADIATYDPVKHDQAYFDTPDKLEGRAEKVLRLACRQYATGEGEACINELLGVIRAEAQQRASQAGQSKARQMILKCFEALGGESAVVQNARKTLARYLFC